MFLKRSSAILAVFALAAFFLSGCRTAHHTTVTLLGDIHYDAAELHSAEVYKNFDPVVPYAQGVLNKEGLFSWRNQTLWATQSLGHDPHTVPRNVKMWQQDMPQLLDSAAYISLIKNSSLVIQLGDMVQGDAGTFELHQKMLAGGLFNLNSRFSVPVLNTMGNHDTRGPGGAEAWRETVETHIDAVMPTAVRRHSNYYFKHQKDLYYFHDVMDPDLSLLEKAVRKKDFRYFFFFSHVPVLPLEKHWMSNILTDDTARLIDLLLENNAFVFSAHTHSISLSRYRVKDKCITQFIINTTLRHPEKQKNFKMEKILTNKKVKLSAPQQALWDKLFAGKVEVEILSDGSGFGLLLASDKAVAVDYYNVSQIPVRLRLR